MSEGVEMARTTFYRHKWGINRYNKMKKFEIVPRFETTSTYLCNVKLKNVNIMVAKKLYFMDCHLAGRKYHDVDEVWNELKVGTIVELHRDLENKFDGYAVEVIYTDANGEKFVLGYLPREENEVLANFLEMGWGMIFETRISRIIPEAHPEQQIQLTIKIKRNEQTD